MKKTTNYQLNQWDKTDRIQMEDFNADNAMLEQVLMELATRTNSLERTCASLGNCAVYTETYAGTGKTGAVSRTFPGKPMMIMVGSTTGYQFTACRGMETVYPHYSNGMVTISLTWEDNSVSWIGNSASNSMNGSGTYCITALLDMSA